MISSSNGAWTLVYSGPTKDRGKEGQHGVGILLNGELSKAWNDGGCQRWAISERVLAIRLPIPGSGCDGDDERWAFIISAYAPTSDPAHDAVREQFFVSVERTLQFAEPSDDIVVAGDWNARVGRGGPEDSEDLHWMGRERGRYGVDTTNEQGRRLLHLCAGTGLTVAASWFARSTARQRYTWTNRGNKRSACIDHILIRQSARRTCVDAGVNGHARRHLPFPTDHELTFVRLRHTGSVRKRRGRGSHSSPPKQRPFPRAALYNPQCATEYATEVDRCLQQHRQNDGDTRPTAQERLHRINAAINTASENLPRPTRKPKPWFLSAIHDLQPLMKARTEAWRRWERASQEDKTSTAAQYRIAKRELRRAIRTAKDNYIHDVLSYTRSNGKRSPWAVVQHITGEKCPRRPTPVTKVENEDGTPCNDPRERWHRHFSRVLNVMSQTKGEIWKRVLPEVDGSQFASLADPPTEEDVRDALEATKLGTAPGLDGIPPEAYVNGGDSLVKDLHALFIQVWEDGAVPPEWRDAELVPLPKKGNLKNCENWRGISLLAVLGKVFAKVIQRRLQTVAEAILPESQCGFRPDRSTGDMIFTVNRLAELARMSGRDLFLVFVDLKKAYDSVPREAMWETLRMFGVPDLLINIIASMHEGMKVKVRVGNDHTDDIEVRNGLRQGCVLAPVLFAIYAYAVLIDWRDRCEQQGIEVGYSFTTKHGGCLPHSNMPAKAIAHSLTQTINECQFADDVALVGTTQNNSANMTRVYGTTSGDWGLSASWTKTKVMRIGPSQRKARPFHVDPDDDNSPVVEAVSKFRYLGVMFSDDGTPDAAVEDRIAKANRAFYSLLVPVFRESGILMRSKRMVYEATVLSSLSYCCHLLPLSQSHHKKLDQFHMSCVRRIVGYNRIKQWKEHTSDEDLRRIFGNLETPSERLRRFRLKWLGHVSRMPPWSLPNQAMFGWMEKKDHGQGGRHGLRWRDVVHRDLETRSLNSTESKWFWLTQDREIWRDICSPPTEAPRPPSPNPTPAAIDNDPDADMLVFNINNRWLVGRRRCNEWVTWEDDNGPQRMVCSRVELQNGDVAHHYLGEGETTDLATTTARNAMWICRLHLMTVDSRYAILNLYDGHYSGWTDKRILDELGTKLKNHDDPSIMFRVDPTLEPALQRAVQDMCET